MKLLNLNRAIAYDEPLYFRVPVDEMYGYKFMAEVSAAMKLGWKVKVDNHYYKDRYYLQIGD